MSFTYSGNPETSTLDAVRFMIGDTNPCDPLLQDEEINYLIGRHANDSSNGPLMAAVFRQAATCLGIRTVKRSLGPQSEDASARLNYFKEMADKYEKNLQYAGVPPLPDYAFEKVFEKGMMANDE